MHHEHEGYMRRCIELAKSGAGHVAPNPMVGAVLVHDNRIIGEGYHKKYGEAHAEVNCINSVKSSDKHLIKKSVLYVSLEPCAHYGKTPPCADLIIHNEIPKVVIGCKDVYAKVNGKGIEKLKQNDIEVTVGVLESDCKALNKRFFTFYRLQRPYIVLKWAQTLDNKIADDINNRLLISNNLSNKIVHKWRSLEAAIMIGTNTALHDDPELTNRLWNGNSPIRLIVDMHLRMPSDLKIFNNNAPTIIFNLYKNEPEPSESLKNKVYYYKIENRNKSIYEILTICFRLKIQSILVEGGKKLLQSFIDENLWDEARIITNTKMLIGKGLSAPELKNAKLTSHYKLADDQLDYYKPDDT